MNDAAFPLTTAPLSREADTSLTEQLARRFADRIRQRLLAPGARLPSVRECAQRHAVSPHTVVAAYDQLLALGLVEARRQRGFFVRETAAPRATAGRGGTAHATTHAPVHEATNATDLVPSHPLPISATALIRGMFQPPGAPIATCSSIERLAITPVHPSRMVRSLRQRRSRRLRMPLPQCLAPTSNFGRPRRCMCERRWV